MSADPLSILRAFATFIGLGVDMAEYFVEAFAAEHPELIAPPDPRTPPEAPTGDIDPEVAAAIERGEL